MATRKRSGPLTVAEKAHLAKRAVRAADAEARAAILNHGDGGDLTETVEIAMGMKASVRGQIMAVVINEALKDRIAPLKTATLLLLLLGSEDHPLKPKVETYLSNNSHLGGVFSNFIVYGPSHNKRQRVKLWRAVRPESVHEISTNPSIYLKECPNCGFELP